MPSESGDIRSFDGDRVMAVFIVNDKNSRAARCALKINWAFSKIVKPKLENAYAAKLGGYELSYASGIDTGEVWAVRGGVRNNSDLVWVGRAPNLAAKLSGIRDGLNRTWITGGVYDRLECASKFSRVSTCGRGVPGHNRATCASSAQTTRGRSPDTAVFWIRSHAVDWIGSSVRLPVRPPN